MIKQGRVSILLFCLGFELSPTLRSRQRTICPVLSLSVNLIVSLFLDLMLRAFMFALNAPHRHLPLYSTPSLKLLFSSLNKHFSSLKGADLN